MSNHFYVSCNLKFTFKLLNCRKIFEKKETMICANNEIIK